MTTLDRFRCCYCGEEATQVAHGTNRFIGAVCDVHDVPDIAEIVAAQRQLTHPPKPPRSPVTW